MNTSIKLTAGAVLLFYAFGAVTAQAMGRPCKADMDKFCKDLKPGENRMDCMKAHEAELSEGCRAMVATRKAGGKGRAAKTMEPCKAEAEKFCGAGSGATEPGCLKKHEGELSTGCRAAIAARKEGMKKENPCFADAEKFCKDVKPGQGAMAKCLKEHEKELSGACAAFKEKRPGMKGPHGGAPTSGE